MSIETYRAADKAVREAMAVKAGEQVVVVTDSLMPRAIPDALAAAAGLIGADATVVVLTSRVNAVRKRDQEQPAHEPPPAAANALASADVVFALTHPILNGTDAETAALRNGARVLRMLLWDFYRDRSEILTAAGEIEAAFLRAYAVDLAELADLTRRATVKLAEAGEARITTPAGTDLAITMERVAGGASDYMSPTVWPNPIQCCDGLCHEPGTWDECAGGNVGVVCTNATGVVVVDHSIPPLGLLNEPITIHIESRRAVSFEGGRSADLLERWLAQRQDANVYICPAEWGLGTHRRCIDSGNFLEHEKAYGAVHVALGDDTRFGGGHAAPTHIDGVLKDAWVEADGNVILSHGKFTV